MQKVLLASTALVMTTGWAMADVTNSGDGVGASITLQGSAAMGIIGKNFGTTEDDEGETIADLDRDPEVSLATDIDIRFHLLGQTDGGLEFGANIDLDETDTTESWQNPETQGGEEIFIRGAFGSLTMGDTDGAFDWAMSEAAIGGSIGDIQEHAGWNGNSGLDGTHDGQVARYEYSFGDFGVAISGEIDDENEADPVLGIGVKYSTSMMAGADLTFGAGVQTVSSVVDLVGDDDDDENASIWGLSADMAFAGGLRTILNYSQADVDTSDDPRHYGIAVGYETGPWLVAMNYGHFDEWVLKDEPNSEGFGVLANYDLGGGASLQGAVSNNVPGDGDDSYLTYSFGVAMSF